MVAGPEVARMVNEFESLKSRTSVDRYNHHEQHKGVQTTFLEEVRSLVGIIEEMGNPFMGQSENLLILDIRDILDTSVGEAV